MAGEAQPREFEQRMIAGWADMDFNGHMRNTAYLEKAVDVRMLYFASAGFSIVDFAKLRLGPVIMTDEVSYRREVGLLETLRATLALAGLAPDASRFRVRNEFYRADGELAARLVSTGGWLCHESRRLIAPPAALAAGLGALARTEDFQVLPSSLR
jgi:acyl-CoA thioester hydrolase